MIVDEKKVLPYTSLQVSSYLAGCDRDVWLDYVLGLRLYDQDLPEDMIIYGPEQLLQGFLYGHEFGELYDSVGFTYLFRLDEKQYKTEKDDLMRSLPHVSGYYKMAVHSALLALKRFFEDKNYLDEYITIADMLAGVAISPDRERVSSIIDIVRSKVLTLIYDLGG